VVRFNVGLEVGVGMVLRVVEGVGMKGVGCLGGFNEDSIF